MKNWQMHLHMPKTKLSLRKLTQMEKGNHWAQNMVYLDSQVRISVLIYYEGTEWLFFVCFFFFCSAQMV